MIAKYFFEGTRVCPLYKIAQNFLYVQLSYETYSQLIDMHILLKILNYGRFISMYIITACEIFINGICK